MYLNLFFGCLLYTNHIQLLVILGEVAEWSKATVLKTVEGETPPRVRIPVSPKLIF
jgi:hypothetical protein